MHFSNESESLEACYYDPIFEQSGFFLLKVTMKIDHVDQSTINYEI